MQGIQAMPVNYVPTNYVFICNYAEKFSEVLKKQQEERSDRERDRIRLLGADPFDADAQQKIAEEIR